MNSPSFILESEFKSLFLADTRWIDVRAPIEFQAGAMPGAVNLPLLEDEERHQVGVTYKQRGQDAAVDLGHQLVSGETKEARLSAWMQEIEAHPEAILYCFRGGMRSQIVQSWLRERGVVRPIVEGGYKALRRFSIEVLENSVAKLDFLVACGPTGSGKTSYLHKSGRPFLDLEAIANHRGSAFGGMGQQPTQVDFEIQLAIGLLRLTKQQGPILIEDESQRIGQRSIPQVLFQKMSESPKVQIEISFEERVENIFQDYILNSSLGRQSDLDKFDQFRRSVTAISRKLGGLRAQEILVDLDTAQSDFTKGLGLDSNRVWIEKLLRWYYDPLYKGT